MGADSGWESARRLQSQSLNAGGGTAPRRHYIDEDAPDPLPLFPEPL